MRQPRAILLGLVAPLLGATVPGHAQTLVIGGLQ